MRKGLHIIRALLPELSVRSCCWCGTGLDERAAGGYWAGTYRPVFKSKPHGEKRLCWDCAMKCASLDGQPEFPFVFASYAPSFFKSATTP